MKAPFAKFAALWTKSADWLDGKKTHIANVLTPVIQYVAYRKHWPVEAAAAALVVTVGLSSFFRMFSNAPGSLSQAAKLPEAEELKVAVRESQAVATQPAAK